MPKIARVIVLSFFVFFVSIIVVMVYRLGIFKDVQISEVGTNSFNLLYKDHVGAYHNIVDTITEVESWARQNNVPCDKSFGAYLDNPEVTPEERLRSFGGCVLIKELDTVPEGFLFKKVQIDKAVMAEFYGSPAAGPFVVYPKINEYVKNKGLKTKPPVYEIYIVLNKAQEIKTEYLFPVVD